MSEEKQVSLGDLTERRRFVENEIKNYSKLVYEFLVGPVANANKKNLTDEELVSKFAFNFAIEPETRHEAHWQLQSFVSLELLQEIKKTNNLLEQLLSTNGQPKLGRRKAKKE